MPGSGRDTMAVQMSLMKKFFFAILLNLSLLLMAGVVQNADALSFQNAQIGNFMISGNYGDTTSQFTVSYIGQPNSLLYGREVILNGVNNGGQYNLLTDFFDGVVTQNPNGTSNYDSTSLSNLVNIGNGGRKLDFGIDYASQNGNIGTEALNGTLNMSIGYADGQYSNGAIPAPNSLSNPTVVPEPISAILFLAGGGVLAGRRYLRRK
jgi:hypothetical protein